VGQLTWYEADDGTGALQEYRACRLRNRDDTPFLLARVKDVLELGPDQAAADYVPNTDVCLYEHGTAAVIYAALSPSWDEADPAAVPGSGADVVVLWVGDASSGWSDKIDEAQRRFTDN
jgi:hypothetical protein